MFIDNLRLRTKILIPVVLMGLVVVGMAAFGAARLAVVSGKASDIIERRDMAAFQLDRASRHMLEAPHSAIEVLLDGADSPEGRTAADGFQKAAANTAAGLDEAMKLAPDRAAQIAKFKESFQRILDKSKSVLEIGQKVSALWQGSSIKPEELDKIGEGASLFANIDMEMRGLIAEIVEFDDALTAENAQAAADLRVQSSHALVAMGVAGLAATLLAGAFSLWLSSSKIARPLSRLSERMGALAKGDLAVEIEGRDRRDEIGEMAKAVLVFKASRGRKCAPRGESGRALRLSRRRARRSEQAQRDAIVHERAIVADSIGAGLSKLAAKDLTYRMSGGHPRGLSQASSRFQRGHRPARRGDAERHRQHERDPFGHAGDLGGRRRPVAAHRTAGGEPGGDRRGARRDHRDGRRNPPKARTMRARSSPPPTTTPRRAPSSCAKPSTAMDAIAKSSQQISQIIGVIDEIAFQTNLLALNAGVEAARAGDAGRGFAVVASEVRALAQRSAEAAKEIKGLISTSTTQVEQGVKLVAETGKSLERIMAQVAEINGVVGEIAAGAKEQATGLERSTRAINQMDQATQQNAAMVEQSTAASHSLSQETDATVRA